MTAITANYWADKEPCWVIMSCSRFLRQKCDAFLHPEKPCWQHETTQCEVVLGIPRSCSDCTVCRRYAQP